MKLPRVRFTTRRMMAAVAAVAILLYSGLLARERRFRLQRARHYASRASEVATWLQASEGQLASSRSDLERTESEHGYYRRLRSRGKKWNNSQAVMDGMSESHRLAIRKGTWEVETAAAEVARFRTLVEFASGQRDRYERASQTPWSLLDPDPPEPK